MANGTDFNEAVEATAVVGALRTDVKTLKNDTAEIKKDVKTILSRVDKAAGIAIGLSSVGAILSIIALADRLGVSK